MKTPAFPCGGRPLFAYGTLMFPEVIARVIGRVPSSEPATLRDFRRLEVKHQVFPGLLASPGNAVQGILTESLSDEEWSHLHAFEDDFYDLCELSVECGSRRVSALGYVVPERFREVLSERDWDPAAFGARHLGVYLEASVPYRNSICAGSSR